MVGAVFDPEVLHFEQRTYHGRLDCTPSGDRLFLVQCARDILDVEEGPQQLLYYRNTCGTTHNFYTVDIPHLYVRICNCDGQYLLHTLQEGSRQLVQLVPAQRHVQVLVFCQAFHVDGDFCVNKGQLKSGLFHAFLQPISGTDIFHGVYTILAFKLLT